MEKTAPLLRFEILDDQLAKSRKILEESSFKNDRDFARLLKSMQKSLDELKAQQAAHLKYRVEYAREMIDVVKMGAINVGPQQRPLQTISEPPQKKQRKSKKNKNKTIV